MRGVAAAMQRHGQPLVGASIAITGNVPRGAGLSSSAALEMGRFTLGSLAGTPIDKVQLALWGQEAENRFVGADPASWTSSSRPLARRAALSVSTVAISPMKPCRFVSSDRAHWW